ncbi:MAG: hypothetical protein ACRDL3_01055 [Solirubrobacterales bacterium]
MSPERPEDQPTAAEERVSGLLELLRGEPLDAPASLTDAVVRTARWQRAVRGTLVLIGEVVAAATAGTEMVLGIEAPGGPWEER